MTQDSAPAGWYDDPSGSGGRRYWTGSAWTDRTQDAGSPASRANRRSRDKRDRLPDGYMSLNGELVPIGRTNPFDARPNNRGLVVAVLVAFTLMALLVAGSALFATSSDISSSSALPLPGGAEDVLVEVESRHGSTIELRWSNGASPRYEDTVDSGWSATTGGTGDGAISVAARPSDGADHVTCRITAADGEVLVEETSEIEGFGVDCRVDRDALP